MIVRNHLRLLHRSIFEDLSPESLENSRHKLVEIMECYRQRAKACQAERDSDLRSMIVTLAMAAETMSSHNDTHSNRLKEFTLKLQETAQATDLGHIKRELRKHVDQLRSTSQSIWQENHDSSSDIQSKLAEFQARLERAEKRATTDALTSLLNRGEGEARLLQQLDSGHMTSVILIDLNGFKQINESLGSYMRRPGAPRIQQESGAVCAPLRRSLPMGRRRISRVGECG